MYRKIIVFIGFYLIFNPAGQAQNDQKVIYNLNDCIRIAIKNNLDLKKLCIKI